MKKVVTLILTIFALIVFPMEQNASELDNNTRSQSDLTIKNEVYPVINDENTEPDPGEPGEPGDIRVFIGEREHIIGPGGVSFPAKINREKQNRHIQGTKEYIPGRSIFSGTLRDAEVLLDKWGGRGKGTWIDTYKERVAFDRNIGTHIDENGIASLTRVALIHYSKTGAHIVPARPI